MKFLCNFVQIFLAEIFLLKQDTKQKFHFKNLNQKTMAKKYYFPKAIPGKRAWAETYKTNIPANGATLAMAQTDVTAEQALCQKIVDVIDAADVAAALAMQKTKDRDIAIADTMKVFALNIQAHKKNTLYNEGIGAALGIIGSEIDFDPMTVKTTVKLAVAPNGVDIKFTLEHAEGGNIYCKRGSETHFTYLKHVTHPHTIDTRPNIDGAASEQRQYYVFLVLNDEEIGIHSDIATIPF